MPAHAGLAPREGPNRGTGPWATPGKWTLNLMPKVWDFGVFTAPGGPQNRPFWAYFGAHLVTRFEALFPREPYLNG